MEAKLEPTKMHLHLSAEQEGDGESHSCPTSDTKEQSARADVLALLKNTLVTPRVLRSSALEMKLP